MSNNSRRNITGNKYMTKLDYLTAYNLPYVLEVQDLVREISHHLAKCSDIKNNSSRPKNQLHMQ